MADFNQEQLINNYYESKERKSDVEKEEKQKKLVIFDMTKNAEITAVIRILPLKSELFFYEYRRHVAEVNGQKFYQPCLRSLSNGSNKVKCPICDNIVHYYNNHKGFYDLVKVKSTFYVNVLVVKCASQPDLEGKIGILRISKRDWERDIQPLLKGDKENDIDPTAFYSIEKGGNFQVKISKADKWNNWSYKYLKDTPLSKDLKDLTRVEKEATSLIEYVGSVFPTKEEFDKTLNEFFSTWKNGSVVETVKEEPKAEVKTEVKSDLDSLL